MGANLGRCEASSLLEDGGDWLPLHAEASGSFLGGEGGVGQGEMHMGGGDGPQRVCALDSSLMWSDHLSALFPSLGDD